MGLGHLRISSFGGVELWLRRKGPALASPSLFFWPWAHRSAFPLWTSVSSSVEWEEETVCLGMDSCGSAQSSVQGRGSVDRAPVQPRLRLGSRQRLGGHRALGLWPREVGPALGAKAGPPSSG